MLLSPKHITGPGFPGVFAATSVSHFSPWAQGSAPCVPPKTCSWFAGKIQVIPELETHPALASGTLSSQPKLKYFTADVAESLKLPKITDLTRQGKELWEDPNQGSHQCFPARCQPDQMWHPWLSPCVFPVPVDVVTSFPFSLERLRWVWSSVGLEFGEQSPGPAVADVSTTGETKTLDLNSFGRGLWHRSRFPVPGLSEIGPTQHSQQYLFPRTLFSPSSAFNTNFIQYFTKTWTREDVWYQNRFFLMCSQKTGFALTLKIIKYL